MIENETYRQDARAPFIPDFTPEELEGARQEMNRLRAEMDDIRRSTPYVRLTLPIRLRFPGQLDMVEEVVRGFEFPDDIRPEWEFLDDHSQGALHI